MDSTVLGQVSGSAVDQLPANVPEITDPPGDVDLTADAPKGPSRLRRLLIWSSATTTAPTRGASDAPDVSETPPQAPAHVAPTARTAPDRSGWAILAAVALAVLVLLIVAVGLRTGLGSIRDAALAAHVEDSAARTYWIGVDGLIVVAIFAALILRNNKGAVWYCIAIIVLFTSASALLQFLHGLGWFASGQPIQTPRGADALPWPVVLVIALLVIGTTAFGTHLLVHVLRHLFPALGDGPAADVQQQVVVESETPISATPDSPVPTLADRPEQPDPAEPPTVVEDIPAPAPDPERVAYLVYSACLDAGVPLSRAKLASITSISERRAGRVRNEVEVDRAEEAARKTAEEQAEAARKAAEKAREAELAKLEKLGPYSAEHPPTEADLDAAGLDENGKWLVRKVWNMPAPEKAVVPVTAVNGSAPATSQSAS